MLANNFSKKSEQIRVGEFFWSKINMNKSLLEKIEDLHSKVFWIFAKNNTKNKIQTQSFKKT